MSVQLEEAAANKGKIESSGLEKNCHKRGEKLWRVKNERERKKVKEWKMALVWIIGKGLDYLFEKKSKNAVKEMSGFFK